MFLARAKQLLKNGGHTIAIVGEGIERTSFKRGVAPVLELINSGVDISGCCVADKVVGRAAALLFVYAGISSVFSEVMSVGAREVLNAHGIPASYNVLSERILNRDKSGFCPMEQTVLGVDSPAVALKLINDKLKSLMQGS